MTTDKNQKNESGTEIALEERVSIEARLSSPSAARNRDVIRDVFLKHMPQQGALLEIGSGTGEHAMHIARALSGLTWQPSDPDLTSRRSIHAWVQHLALANVLRPLALDVTMEDWHLHPGLPSPLSAMMSVNMIHIAPFEAAMGLFAGAGKLLNSDDKLFLYGPFKRYGKTSASNHDFDTSLKSRNQSWGVRDLDEEIIPLGQNNKLKLETIVEMPANNLSVVFVKQ